MLGVMALLHAVHIEIPRFEIDLLPPQCHEFRGAEAMAIHQQNDGRISHPMAAGFTYRLHYGVHLVRAKIVSH
jgi:hypothetical protein